MIKAVLFDCFGVLMLPDAIGVYRTPNQPLFDFIKTDLASFKTGIISNIARDNLVELMGEENRKLFQTATLSCEVGTTKPDPVIYEAALDSLQLEAQECIFVDDIEAFTVAASKLGMHTIHFQSTDQVIRDLKALIDN